MIFAQKRRNGHIVMQSPTSSARDAKVDVSDVDLSAHVPSLSVVKGKWEVAG